MKHPLLLSAVALSLVALTATTLYAQATGTSVIDRMKAAAHAFTLTADLNAGQTGITSSPVVGKKTGDVLTAGEYNRLLELVSEGGSSGAFGTAWVNFDGTESTITMKGASGIASVTKVSAGNYQINFSTPKANTDYGVICTSGPSPAYLCFPHSKTTTGVLIKTSNPTSNVDAAYVSVVIN